MPPDQLSNSDWIAVSSAIVAFCALAIAIWQGYLTRRHNVLSVRPYLEVVVTSSMLAKSHLVLKNGGLGPAVLDLVQFVYKKKTIDIRTNASYTEFLKLLALDFGDVKAEWYVPDKHSIISPGESIQLLAVSSERDALKLKKAFDAVLSVTSVVVEYKCMYGKNYRSELDAMASVA